MSRNQGEFIVARLLRMEHHILQLIIDVVPGKLRDMKKNHNVHALLIRLA